ncbi:MAG: ADP-ribosylglycohydrolase family protein [Planctomycetes bacterium]|nr:ADP-ribosylglycohydrolase family protein [Planctomycetota bacterium]
MKTKNLFKITICILFLISSLATKNFPYTTGNNDKSIEMPAEVLRDKIRGGLLGQLLGNLNGLKHEMKYINQPGNVNTYTPALPEGARTDDDTDLEWVYIVAMQRNNTVLLSPHRIVQLWKQRINNRIWCSNQYARQLMDIGFQPPLTGSIVFNPWANFNISGQFICESFGLVAPGMPQTAAKIGLNYTRVTIDSEPAQTTQLFTTMIATAFITDDIDNIIEAGLKAIDTKCTIRQIVNDVRKWHRLYPKDWRTTRRLVKEKYSLHGGEMRDRNGHELNTASTIAALLYGRGDFVKTLMTAFNFGWDADNNAATSGTIIGVIKGYRWMMQQNWQIVDRYHNTTRDNMPMDETITSFADRIIDLSERIIIENGGQRKNISGQIVYYIPTEKPKNIVPLPDLDDEIARMQLNLKPEIKNIIKNENDIPKLALAAYSAICLDLAESMNENYPQRWSKALDALNKYPKVVQVLFFQSPFTEGDLLRKKAIIAGLKKPKRKTKIW